MTRGEHHVFFDVDRQRYIKITHHVEAPERSGFAVAVDVGPGSYMIGKESGLWLCVPSIRAAEPIEYLSRVVLFNRTFGDDIQLEGVICEAGREAIVTSQPAIRGASATPAQVREGMEALGFVLSDFPPLGRTGVVSQSFYNPVERVAVFDTHAENFIVQEGIVAPIDALMTTMDESLERCLAMPMAERKREIGLQTSRMLGW